MSAFRTNVTRIKGLSDRRRMPLLGKIRLGIKIKNAQDVEYPKETDYFVCPPEVEKEFGKEPKILPIMLPMNDIDAVFPCAYIYYGKSKGVICKGNGETAECVDPQTKAIVQQPCPCEHLESKKCKQVGRLLFMIPQVSVAGVYQITTSSFNSIIDIQSGLDYVQAMVGRFAFISLQLKRIPTITHHNEKRQTHYTIQLTLPDDFNLQALADLKADNERIYTQAQYQLPAPVDENPELDPPDEIIDEEDVPPPPPDPPPDEMPDISERATGPQYKKLYAMLKEATLDDDDIELFKDFVKQKKGVEVITKDIMSKIFDNFEMTCEAFWKWEKRQGETQQR